MRTIVVGVDGSAGSAKALKFAFAEAQIRGAKVKVVGAWHIPPIVYEAGWVPASVDFDAFREDAQAALETALAEAGADTSGVEVETTVAKGQAADVLCAEALNADLLVVGSRGLGGFRGLMLGSVSQQCAHHAPCPVVIVPAADPDEA